MIKIGLCRRDDLSIELTKRGFKVGTFPFASNQLVKSRLLNFKPQIVIFSAGQTGLYNKLKNSELNFIPIFLTSLPKEHPQFQEIIASEVPENLIFSRNMNNQSLSQAILEIASQIM
jgi:hypothetical protein